jgi:hypothetical protein
MYLAWIVLLAVSRGFARYVCVEQIRAEAAEPGVPWRDVRVVILVAGGQPMEQQELVHRAFLPAVIWS